MLWKRTVLHSTLVGALANGPMLHAFFEAMDRWVTLQHRVLNVIAKVVALPSRLQASQCFVVTVVRERAFSL